MLLNNSVNSVALNSSSFLLLPQLKSLCQQFECHSSHIWHVHYLMTETDGSSVTQLKVVVVFFVHTVSTYMYVQHVPIITVVMRADKRAHSCYIIVASLNRYWIYIWGSDEENSCDMNTHCYMRPCPLFCNILKLISQSTDFFFFLCIIFNSSHS